MKRKIGITYTKTNFEHYWGWIRPEELGEGVEIVLLSFEDPDWQLVGACDGFILTGGIDVAPSLYGGDSHYPHRPDLFQMDRDHFEEKVFRAAQDRHKPVLGICRGLQLINVIQGGKLIQDLGSANELHRKTHSDRSHPVEVEPGTLLHEVVESIEGTINSAHHQAIDPGHLGSNLKINALSKDRVIEGMEYEQKKGLPFLLCVQWHPERMVDRDSNPFAHKIKARFIQEVNKTHQQ